MTNTEPSNVKNHHATKPTGDGTRLQFFLFRAKAVVVPFYENYKILHVATNGAELGAI